jgi:predicted DNA-binding protein
VNAQFNFRVPPEFLERLKAVAKAKGVSHTDYARNAIEKAMNHDERAKP